MEDFLQYVENYRIQLRDGGVRAAYQGILGYISGLRLHLNQRHFDYSVSSGIQDGRMDYTYFYCTPKSLKMKKLKIVLLFIHDTFAFEIWLSGINKSVQKHYQDLFRKNGWNKYCLSRSTDDVFSIIEHTITEEADFSNSEKLTERLEDEAEIFISEIVDFLSIHDSDLP